MKTLISLVALVLIFFSGCSDDTETNPSVVLQSISVTPTSTILDLGTTESFQATGQYSDSSSKDITDTVIWSLENSTGIVEEVNASLSYVKAVSIGSDTLQATLNGVSGSAEITVVEASLSMLTITPETLDLMVDRRAEFIVEGLYSDGHTQDLTDEATWASDDNTTLKRETTSDGVWYAGFNRGIANVTASFDGQIGRSLVAVYELAEVVSIEISPKTVTLAKSETQIYTATALLDDGTRPDISSYVSYRPKTDADREIVGFGVNGNTKSLTALRVGDATVVGTYNEETNLSDEATVTVVP